MALCLTFRPGNQLLINGAELTFLVRTKMRVENQARFLFGHQVLPEAFATTPARKLYFALQRAYTGAAEDAEVNHDLATEVAFRTEGLDRYPRQLARIQQMIARPDYLSALRVAQEMINLEDLNTEADYVAA